VLVPIGDIKLNEKNRNRHSEEQINRLAKIISYQGFRNPLTISNQSGLCVAGEGRYLAAKKLGLTELPVCFQDFDDQDQETAHGIADNAIQGQWMDLDLSGINSDLIELGPDFNIENLGMKNFMLDLSDINLEEKPPLDDENKKYVIEVHFPNDCEMNDIKDDLLSRGYIVKVK
jgi:hypothetical protein